MKKVVFIFYSIFFFHSLFSQEAGFDWAGSFGSSTFEEVNSICSDNLGNSYVTGPFIATIDFDFGIDVYELVPIGGADMFIAKYSNSGEFEWCKHIGNPLDVSGYDIYCDEAGNLFITGYFSGTVDFDAGAEVFELNGGLNGDCFILKLDTDGNFVWAKSFGDGLLDIGVEITTDDAGNIYTTGTFQGTVDFDPSVGVFDITSNGEEDVFIQKLNSAGELIWAKSIGGAAEERVETIAVDGTENIYLGGKFEGSCDFNPDLGVYSYTSNGLFDGYVLKLNTDGSFDWAIQNGGSSQETVFSVKIDTEDHIYVAGSFMNTVDFQPGIGVSEKTSNGSRDVFVQKLNNEGDLIWVKTFGGSGWDQLKDMEIRDEVFLTGYFVETVDFDPNGGVLNLTSNGSADVFIQKLDFSGNLIWAKAFGGSGYEEGFGISVTLSNDLFSIGTFENTVDFNPNEDEFDLTSNGEYDIFILKLNACSPNAVTDVVNSCISYTWIDGTTYYEDNNSATVTLTNILGCDSVVTLDLTINEVNITTTAVGGVLSSNAIGATYQWLDCNDAYSEIAGATNQSYTPIDDGDYAVKVTIGSCTDTSACIAVDGVGLTDNNLSQIHLYPNPNNGLFNINLGQVQATLIQISSANGTIIYSNSTNLTGIHQIALNISAGLYFVDVLTESGTYQMKLVVE
jgi:hypothetical protein